MSRTTILAVIAVLLSGGDATRADQFATSLPAEVPRELGPRQGVSRNDSHPRADLHQRPVALAARRGQSRQVPAARTGATSRSPGAGRESPTTCRRTARRSSRIRAGRTRGWAASPRPGTSARSRPRRLGRPPHCPVRGVPEFATRPSTSTASRSGEIRFPGGELDLTPVCRPGGKHVLSLLVVALPLKGVMLSYTDTASARQVPEAPWSGAACAATSISSARRRRADRRREGRHVGAQGRITFDAALQGLAAGRAVRLLRPDHERRPRRARVREPSLHGRRSRGRPHSRSPRTGSPRGSGTSTRRRTCTTLGLSLLDAEGRVLDTAFGRAIRLPRVLDRRPRLLS